jgi:hypothetical protein
MHDKPFWRRSDEVKRITGDQRKFRPGAGFHNLRGFRIDNFRRVDYVLVRSADGCKPYAVAGYDPIQFAEERVAVRCDRDVAVCAG